MILKGSQRGGGYQLADHLMNDRDNDHVTLYDLRGFVASDLRGALAETHAISKGTQCQQYMFSLSLNPPKDAHVKEEDFLRAADQAEEKLGLSGQPRAIVLHEKEGRRHAHVVWSRIDPAEMKAINLSHFKQKLTALSRELYLSHDWDMPDGLRPDKGKSPLNFTLGEWQQAKRLDLDPREIKQSFQQAWAQSDNATSFKHALEERGYFLAQGDRRGFVAIDVYGEIYSVPKWTGLRTKEIREKLGDPNELPTLDDARLEISDKLTSKLRDFIQDVRQKHRDGLQPLKDRRNELVKEQRTERKALIKRQAERWKAENAIRQARVAKGLKGLWERMTGKRAEITAQNEREAWLALKRDAKERDTLVLQHLDQRQSLQKNIRKLRLSHIQERKLLNRDIHQASRLAAQRKEMAERSLENTHKPRFKGIER